MNQQELAKHLFIFLDSSNIDYVVVGDTRGYPNEIQSDIDIVVDAQLVRDFNRKLVQYCSGHDLKMVQIFRHEYSSWYFILCGMDEKGKACFLHPDVCGDYFRFGRLLLKAQDLLHGRIQTQHGDNTRSFFVPPPAAGFIYYLLKKIDKMHISRSQGDFLSAEWKRDPIGARGYLKRFWSEREVEDLAQAAENNSWAEITATVSHFQKALWRNIPASAKHRYLEVIRQVSRVMQPTGIHVVFLGGDGSGKSTIIEQVERDLAPAFRNTKHYHLRPFFGFSKQPGAPVRDPHAQLARGQFLSLAKLGWWVLDFTVGYLVEILPRLLRSTLVLFDRYYDDLLVDHRRYRYGGPSWAVLLGTWLIPSPDLVILLDAPAEVLRMRKQELPVPEIERQRLAYRALIERLPNSCAIDASQSFDKVVVQVESKIVEYLEKRLAARLRVTSWIRTQTD